MNYMNDDFVPFELAVKLKEKDYPQIDFLRYDEQGELYIGDDDYPVCAAPTISQVLKWLRKKKKIVISIFPHPCGWQADIYKDVHQYYDSEAERDLMYYYKEKTEISHSYNWLEIYCIRYVLDNLI